MVVMKKEQWHVYCCSILHFSKSFDTQNFLNFIYSI
jgi:hypothetical protein